MDTLIGAFAQKGDIAHLALFAWALGASVVALRALSELARAHRLFADFVRELARFNARHRPGRTAPPRGR